MKRVPFYMMAFGCGYMVAWVAGIIDAKNAEARRWAMECPLPDEDRVSEQAAVCERVCGSNRIARFKPGPWAHSMVCECIKP